jgi:serine/threonine protein kinase
MPGRRVSRRNFRSNRSLRKRKKTRSLRKKSRAKSLRKRRMRRGGLLVGGLNQTRYMQIIQTQVPTLEYTNTNTQQPEERLATNEELFNALREHVLNNLIHRVFGHGGKSLKEERKDWTDTDFTTYCENKIYVPNITKIDECIKKEKLRATSNEVPEGIQQTSIWSKILPINQIFGKSNTNYIDLASKPAPTEIDGGAFGIVYLLGTKMDDPPPLIVKTYKTDNIDPDKLERIIEDFNKEALILKFIIEDGKNHPNIVDCLGFSVIYKKPAIVFEYCKFGNLKKYFIVQGSDTIKPIDQFKFALDIATGMDYLHSIDILHLDLAVKNVLVCGDDQNKVCKITDFGFSVFLHTDSGKNKTDIKGKSLPSTKWLAPEFVKTEHDLYTTYTKFMDVWSFGVTLFEILTFGINAPYPSLTKELLLKNHIKSKEHKDENYFYDMIFNKDRKQAQITKNPTLNFIIKECMNLDINKRPTFTKLIILIKTAIDASAHSAPSVAGEPSVAGPSIVASGPTVKLVMGQGLNNSTSTDDLECALEARYKGVLKDSEGFINAGLSSIPESDIFIIFKKEFNEIDMRGYVEGTVTDKGYRIIVKHPPTYHKIKIVIINANGKYRAGMEPQNSFGYKTIQTDFFVKEDDAVNNLVTQFKNNTKFKCLSSIVDIRDLGELITIHPNVLIVDNESRISTNQIFDKHESLGAFKLRKTDYSTATSGYMLEILTKNSSGYTHVSKPITKEVIGSNVKYLCSDVMGMGKKATSITNLVKILIRYTIKLKDIKIGDTDDELYASGHPAPTPVPKGDAFVPDK